MPDTYIAIGSGEMVFDDKTDHELQAGCVRSDVEGILSLFGLTHRALPNIDSDFRADAVGAYFGAAKRSHFARLMWSTRVLPTTNGASGRWWRTVSPPVDFGCHKYGAWKLPRV
ncbi:hypothetical protein LQ948_10610 [Jiella sp. MQZ9-1]|uniref:Uncharacterized protein n=1 Tax=Jiella flava TaxID=2816857 RepID=A0A939JTS6_9HYPH|nr:hypothetical protein [Jiella flava]MBO0662435.1 hypothetical protein [Jiella flava]MCD2471658.1 hypothetical protein [Jiella flava]